MVLNENGENTVKELRVIITDDIFLKYSFAYSPV